MKKLGDYKDEEAIDLWMDLLDPIGEILQDKEVAKIYKKGGKPIQIAQEIVKRHRKDATQILLRIDPTPIDGLNIIIRLLDVIMEFERSEELKNFFGSAGTATEGVSPGNATENTEAKEA